MYSRVTLLEIDTLRTTIEEAAELFKEDVLPRLREQHGFVGAVVLATADGKGMIITTWESEEAAAAAAAFASAELGRYMTLFKAPPGREYYEVVFVDMPNSAPV
jgi:hypothetical protein